MPKVFRAPAVTERPRPGTPPGRGVSSVLAPRLALLVAALFVGLASIAPTQTVAAQDQQASAAAERWRPLMFLLGSWTGEEEASFGRGRGERRYELILQGRYLLGRNQSIFQPQDGLPSGDAHEDWSVYSYDTARETYVVRQFNSEGFVNTFVLRDREGFPDRMVFDLEASEGAAGASAVLTLERAGADGFEETFELTMPGAPAPLTIRNRWTRVQ